MKVIRTAAAWVLVCSIGVPIGIAVVVIPVYLYDRYYQAVWNEEYEIISQENGETVLHISADRHRGDLDLLEYRDVEVCDDRPLPQRFDDCAAKRVVTRQVRPVGWAIGVDGKRRKISLRPFAGNGPRSYPAGPADFGRWVFSDPLGLDGPPIAAVEIEVTYDGIFGPREEILGPFAIT